MKITLDKEILIVEAGTPVLQFKMEGKVSTICDLKLLGHNPYSDQSELDMAKYLRQSHKKLGKRHLAQLRSQLQQIKESGELTPYMLARTSEEGRTVGEWVEDMLNPNKRYYGVEMKYYDKNAFWEAINAFINGGDAG